MATLAQRILSRNSRTEESRFGMDWYVQQWLNVAGTGSFMSGLNTTWSNGDGESAPANYDQYAMSLFAADPVVFAAVVTRLAVFSQAELKYQRLEDRKLFGDRTLRIFERPWPGGTTSDLLGKMLTRADLSGNAYVWNSGRRLHVWRPDWVTIVLGSDLEPEHPAWGEDVEVLGYMYSPGGAQGKSRSRLYSPDEVSHFAPLEDPTAHYRGMSWLTPVLREVQADKAATEHKIKFFQNAATPNMVVKFDPQVTADQVREFKDLMESEHTGYTNAYKNLYLGGGADATVVGANFQQLDFSKTQGKGETRIALASGVPAAILGISEGLAGSQLNAGNYGQAKRLFGDVRLQHLWMNAVSSLETLVSPPGGTRLWFDKRIPFLQDDLKDTAEVQAKQAAAIRQLVDGGFDPTSVIQAVQADDMSMLRHTGKLSVQLQPPGTADEPATD